jgi:NADPH:quinone reductase-like Zn-dependent oxidoreductase
VAGEVAAVGKNVARLKPVTRCFRNVSRIVCGVFFGPESRLAVKPVNVTFEQAASVELPG